MAAVRKGRLLRTDRQAFRGGFVLLLSSLAWSTAKASWVDPDSPSSAHTSDAKTQGDDRKYVLVFSDEFEEDGRTFTDGSDPRWTAIDKNDYTNDALHFYRPQNVFTSNGKLNITTELKTNSYKAFNEKTKKFYTDQKYVQSAMIQSWNKFCFIGGIVEFSAKLPGDPEVGGLWPAIWMLGNLARATYVGSSNYIWPWSYNKCTENNRISQEINACQQVNHYGLEQFRGRGSPEIDIIEAMQGDNEKLPNTHIRRPYQSASLQVAPGIDVDRPLLGHRPHPSNWYQHLEYGNVTKADLNPFFYGVKVEHELKSQTYQSDAISANAQLQRSHYEDQHTYRVEWEPPDRDGNGGYVKWFTDGNLVSGIFGDSLKIMQTEIPSEPMYMLLNTAVSSSWGFPMPCPEGCECDCFECGNPTCACGIPAGYCNNFPAAFEIDYVRLYQAVNESRHVLGCSPAHRPTEQFIEGHNKRYISEGQTVPLLTVLAGGGICTKDDNCGSGKKGNCSSSGTCKCAVGWTGPHCRSHSGFYDVDTRAPQPGFSISRMVLPPSLIVVIALLIISFASSLFRKARARARDSKYQKIPLSTAKSSDGLSFSPPSAHSNATYQNPAPDHYALPPTQKEVTYCVIDGRLVDS